MIVYCCADLIFATKVRSTCDALALLSRPARNTEMLQNRLNQVDDGKPNDPVAVVLIDLDMGDDAIELIQTARAHNPELPIIAWGPHVAVELMEHASQAGASRVMARGAFTAQLPQLLERFRQASQSHE